MSVSDSFFEDTLFLESAKLDRILFLFFSILIAGNLSAQEITYSEYNNEDNRDIRFEILGKMEDHYVIYKNIRWKHVLAFYDNDMRIKKSLRLAFVPDKTFNIDFVTYPGQFYLPTSIRRIIPYFVWV